ncbi:MAG: hypothetical protein WBF33_33095 [Candidatus Nitrosopolaris sp.]
MFYLDDYMKGLIFDLVDFLTEPVYYDPWEEAFDESINIESFQRANYLLEGMRRIGLVKRIFELKRFDESRTTQATKSKDDLCKIFSFKFERACELVTNLVICFIDMVLVQLLGFGKDQFHVIIIPYQMTKGLRLDTEDFKSLNSEIRHTRSAIDVV